MVIMSKRNCYNTFRSKKQAFFGLTSVVSFVWSPTLIEVLIAWAMWRQANLSVKSAFPYSSIVGFESESTHSAANVLLLWFKFMSWKFLW